MVYHMQYGFIVGEGIIDNILNVQMVVDNVKKSKQKIVMIRLDVDKAYDHVSLSFVTQLMSHMGFGARMSQLSFMLGLSAMSHVVLNGGAINAIRQGCPLIPLLFAIATHSILVRMHEL